jgi:hypothetical protein
MTQWFIPAERKPQPQRSENLDEPNTTNFRNCLYHRCVIILLIIRLFKRDVLIAVSKTCAEGMGSCKQQEKREKVAYLRALFLIEQRRRRGRRRKQLLEYIKKKRRFWKFEKVALCAELVLEEVMDLWKNRLQNE